MKAARLAPLLAACCLLPGCGAVLSTADLEPIAHDPGERSLGARIDDETIETRAIVNIGAADEALDASHINVTSYNGYVLIVGQVPSEALKNKAAEVVKRIRHVRRIYNELEVAGNNSMVARTGDAWITAKVKSILLLNKETEGLRVKVVTENGVVYLMGLASRAEAARIEKKVSAIQGVRRVIALFEYFDEERPLLDDPQ